MSACQFYYCNWLGIEAIEASSESEILKLLGVLLPRLRHRTRFILEPIPESTGLRNLADAQWLSGPLSVDGSETRAGRHVANPRRTNIASKSRTIPDNSPEFGLRRARANDDNRPFKRITSLVIMNRHDGTHGETHGLTRIAVCADKTGTRRHSTYREVAKPDRLRPCGFLAPDNARDEVLFRSPGSEFCTELMPPFALVVSHSLFHSLQWPASTLFNRPFPPIPPIPPHCTQPSPPVTNRLNRIAGAMPYF